MRLFIPERITRKKRLLLGRLFSLFAGIVALVILLLDNYDNSRYAAMVVIPFCVIVPYVMPYLYRLCKIPVDKIERYCCCLRVIINYVLVIVDAAVFIRLLNISKANEDKLIIPIIAVCLVMVIRNFMKMVRVR
jgi:hypothetical protein